MRDAVLIISMTLSGLEVVGLFTVLGDVQTFDLFGLAHAHTVNHIRYFQQHNGSNQRESHPGNAQEVATALPATAPGD